MTYCIDFFRKFKKEGNFCGLDKSEVSRLNAYLDIVEMLMKQRIPEETVYTNFPVYAARPLLTAKGEERTEALNYVTSELKSGKKITQGGLQSNLKQWKLSPSVDYDDKKLENSNSPTKQKPKLPVEKEPIKEPIVLHPSIKKQDPGKCFSPQPGTIEVTDASPQPSLAQQMKEVEPEPGIIPFTPPKPRPAPCLSGQPCPDGKEHKTVLPNGKIPKCVLFNQYINQLIRDECYLDAKKRQATTKPGLLEQGNTAFSRAGEIPKAETKWGSGKMLTREEKMHILCTQILIPKQVRVLTSIVKTGEADDELMALDVIIQEALERMGA